MVSQYHPNTIDDIERRGHEIGYHTHSHRLLHNKEVLEGELKNSSNFLHRFKPTGFRAPQIFITRDSFVCLKEYGFRYSSSSYSGYRITNIDGIDEIPVSAFCFMGSDDNNQHLPKSLTINMLSRQNTFRKRSFHLSSWLQNIIFHRVVEQKRYAINIVFPSMAIIYA